ncbi:TPA: hypothetical protein PFE28_004474 [Kluyvera cryocrescens]|nr:hypothetical protein [Kluyvera cryocrescens]
MSVKPVAIQREGLNMLNAALNGTFAINKSEPITEDLTKGLSEMIKRKLQAGHLNQDDTPINNPFQ